RVEPPRKLAGIRVESREESAYRILGATDTHDDFALGDSGRHRDRIIVLRKCDSGFPHRLAGFCVEAFESAVDHGGNGLALVKGRSAIHDSATDLRSNRRLIDFRIPSPEFFACAGIEGIDNTPVRDAEQLPIPHQRRALLIAASRTYVVCPGKTKAAHVG